MSLPGNTNRLQNLLGLSKTKSHVNWFNYWSSLRAGTIVAHPLRIPFAVDSFCRMPYVLLNFIVPQETPCHIHSISLCSFEFKNLANV